MPIHSGFVKQFVIISVFAFALCIIATTFLIMRCLQFTVVGYGRLTVVREGDSLE